MVLHGHEAGPAAEVGEIERLGELPGVHGRGTDVADLAGLHSIVERFEGFFDRSFVIPAMGLVEVDVVGLQAAEALVEFMEDGFARETAAVGFIAHDAVDLGGDDDGFAAGVGLEEVAQNDFAVAARIDIGCIEEVDAEVEGLAQEGPAFFLVHGPVMTAANGFAGSGRAIGHAAQADAGNLESGFAEIDVVHWFSRAREAHSMLNLFNSATRAAPTFGLENSPKRGLM